MQKHWHFRKNTRTTKQ